MAVAAKGDFVLIQMGHNDGGSITDAKGRASLPGLGDETQDVTTAMGKKETVHTFGWYMGKFVTDSHDKGMTAIICSPIPHYPAQPVVAGQLEQSKGATWNMVTWSEEVAKKQNAPFIQLNGLILSHFVGMDPQEIMAKYYSPDRTHTQGAGAILNAQCVVDGIRSLADCPLKSYLLDTPETFTLPTTRANGRPTTLPADSNRAAPGAQ
jgi:lysophospholipase L1-like esterase